jgi:hypothetical protein
MDMERAGQHPRFERLLGKAKGAIRVFRPEEDPQRREAEVERGPVAWSQHEAIHLSMLPAHDRLLDRAFAPLSIECILIA